MKKYSKPILNTEVIENIGEAVFLVGSGWTDSDCYLLQWQQTQPTALGRDSWVYQIDAWHGKNWQYQQGVWGVTAWEECDHLNEGQYLIVEFANALPSAVTGIKLNDVSCTISPDRTMARVPMNYHQNKKDQIGLASYQITFYEGAYEVDDAMYSLIEFSSFYITDTHARHN